MSGIVDRFECSSDTREQLTLCLQILMVWNSTISTYEVGKDIRGRSFLTLRWHESGGGTKFLAPLKDPKTVADQVYAWLGDPSTVYPSEPDLDGSCYKGWRVSTTTPENKSYDPYAVCTIYTYWTEYSK